MNVSIVIPNYNGQYLLEKNLPVLFAALKDFDGEYEVIIVDDGSSDNSVGFIHSFFKQVKTINLDKNYGFAYACNAGVKQSRYEIVYLLNSDVAVGPGFLPPLLKHFSDKNVFAVSSIAPNQDQLWVPWVRFRLGIFWYWYKQLPDDCKLPIDLFITTAGHTAFDKNKFIELNGFDVLFSPFYAEDGDICWRAAKRGWRIIMEPQSYVKHSCAKTINSFYSDAYIKKIHWKNRTLMTWKNLTNASFIVRHILFLLLELPLMPLIGKKEFSLGVILALKQLPQLLSSRQRDRVEHPLYSDRELFSGFPRFTECPDNVLYLHETSQFSGAENSLFNLAIKLDKLKFRPIFALPAEGPFVVKLRKSGFIPVFIRFHRVFNILAFCKDMLAVVSLVKKTNVQIIHSNSFRTHLYSFLAGRLCSIPVIWHERNLITNELIDPEKMLSLLPDRIICNSGAIASRFLSRGKLPAKVSVVYNGVDSSLFHPSISGSRIRNGLGISSTEVVVGMASRFNRLKGHEVFLKAAQVLINYRQSFKSNLKFLIVGGPVFDSDRYMEGVIKDQVVNFGLGEKVIFTGFRDDMPEIYAAMDIFVLPAYAEACGRVILEAMSSAKPVIATNSGGTPEILEDQVNGFLFEPDDFKTLADKIALLAEDPKLAEKIGRKARSRIEERFNIENNVSQIQDIYAKLLCHGRH